MPDSLQAVSPIVWGTWGVALALLLLDPAVRGLLAKAFAWLRGLLPGPAPQPAPTPPVGDPIAAYRLLKIQCANCPAEVQAAFRVIWTHLEPGDHASHWPAARYGHLSPQATKGGGD